MVVTAPFREHDEHDEHDDHEDHGSGARDLSRLARDLVRLTRPGTAVPEDRDVAIRRMIHARFAARGRRRWRLAAGLAAGVLAAAALTAGLLRPVPAPPRPLLAGDVDGDGVVDILDAAALDRLVRRGAAPARFDLDGDGTVDARDVETAAGRAVALDRRIG